MNAQFPPALQKAVEAVNRNPHDFDAAARLCSLLHEFGMREKAAEVQSHIVCLLQAAIAADGTPNRICSMLAQLYALVVKKVESEDHVRACYQLWVDTVAAVGRKHRSRDVPRRFWNAYPARPWRPGFFLHSAHILGHTEALLEMLAYRPRGGKWENPVVYVFDGNLPELNDRLAKLDVSVRNISDQIPTVSSYLEKFDLLRRMIERDRISHLVWVSAPVLAEFALPMRLAPAQIFWTLKFHPFQLPEIDGYISYGSWSEQTRTVHGEEWQVVPFMMSQSLQPVSESDIAQLRGRFGKHRILFGTLGRTEKLNSVPFLDAVVRILRENPDSGYLWTGREHHGGIQSHFEQAGVAEQCHFVGWVNTSLYARALDVFLESFPFGCGLTGIQALQAGTPLVSYAAPETQYGMHFMRPLEENGPAAAQIRTLLAPGPDAAPLLYPANADEYVAIANRLARDDIFRRAAGLAGQQYYLRHLNDATRMAERFYEVLANVRPRARAA